MGTIKSLLFFIEYGFGNKYPGKVDKPLNKESELNVQIC